jgi:hypothetical protein
VDVEVQDARALRRVRVTPPPQETDRDLFKVGPRREKVAAGGFFGAIGMGIHRTGRRSATSAG